LSVTVEVDTSELDGLIESITEKFGSMGEIFEQGLDTIFIPRLEAEAGSQRKVRTGTYAYTWEALAEGDDSAIIRTEADYWIYLEYGTSRGIAPKPVVQLVVGSSISDFMEYVVNSVFVG
jgi:hypothetical protein